MHILFDYGHGGNDPGATYKGRLEKNDVLKLGQAVAKKLRAANISVDETRTTDINLTLQQRVNLERSEKYDYFISFHRNASKPEHATGAEVFVYSPADWTRKGDTLAADIQHAMVTAGLTNRGVKQADYYVLKNTRAAAVLVEVGFIDNSNDNRLFDAHFEKLADGIANAILKAAGKTPKQAVCTACGRAM